MEIRHISLFMMLCLEVHRSSSDILQRQKRKWEIKFSSIDEGYEGHFPYSLGIIKAENVTLFKIHGEGVDETPQNVLKINSYTGEISVHSPVDYEKFKLFKLTVEAQGTDMQLQLLIEIIDSNDNPPKFDLERYEISIQESTSQGTEVVTVKASDFDTEKNGIFDLRIVSVSPKPHELEFYLTQITNTQTGTVSFKGCLDHEKAEKYTIIVEAKDRGEKTQLSGFCTIIVNIEDGNNHLPMITGQTGPGRVKEGAKNVLVSRLQVTDKDTKGTAAWRAKYQIQGDTNNNFRITTDPETNEGLLYVKKHLDYEEGSLKNLAISVENEIPSHSCKVVHRSTTGLWKVVTNSGSATGRERLGPSTRQVTVTVDDVNEAPTFDKPNKQVLLGENVEPGHYLETFTARDPDLTSANTFVYIKGEDPASWVTVDPFNGNITTSKIIDRESPFVKGNTYMVTIYAVDNGKPQMTGTATLNLYIIDENDNAPFLAVSTIDMCQSDGPSLANITVLDLDTHPYGGPFNFKLLGDVTGKWSVDRELGYSVNLVKENSVHSGHFELLLKLTDLQGETSVHRLSVTVCNCLNTARPKCRIRKATCFKAGRAALGIIVFSILLFAGTLLLVVQCKTKQMINEIPDDGPVQHLMKSNTENLGSDCQSFTNTTTAAVPQAHSENIVSQTERQQRKKLHWSLEGHQNFPAQWIDVLIGVVLNMMLNTQHEEELGDYAPHVYAEEDDTDTYTCELDAISIPDISFDQDLYLGLDFKFNTLASVCMSGDCTAYSTNTACEMETQLL